MVQLVLLLFSGHGVSASMSSLYSHKYPADKAIDGLYTPVLRGDKGKAGPLDLQSIAHTKKEKSPWLQIDLGEEKCIVGVPIWNRGNNPLDTVSRTTFCS